MAARHGTDVELAVCAMVDVNESPAARKSARLLWDLLRYAIILHVAWVAAWVLLHSCYCGPFLVFVPCKSSNSGNESALCCHVAAPHCQRYLQELWRR